MEDPGGGRKILLECLNTHRAGTFISHLRRCMRYGDGALGSLAGLIWLVGTVEGDLTPMI
jgi:hypothetical protein